jgi:hypothetical protein
MNIPALIEEISSEVLSWSEPSLEVVVSPHRYGGREFRLKTTLHSKELGHIHDFGVLDILFTKALREQLVTEEKVRPHHYVPASGWTSYHLNRSDSLQHALWLLRLSYVLHVFRITKNRQAAHEELQRLQASSAIESLILGKREVEKGEGIAA